MELYKRLHVAAESMSDLQAGRNLLPESKLRHAVVERVEGAGEMR